MAEDTYSGTNVFLIIEKQGRNYDTPRLSQCPLPWDLMYDASATPNIVRQNGIMYVSASYTSPYKSFQELITPALHGDSAFVGWVFDVDTGEGRYYDGNEQDADPADPGLVDVCWTPEQRAIGRVYNFKPKTERPVTEMPEIGAMYPAALKSGRYNNSFSFDKTWIDKNKLYHGTPLIGVDTREIPVNDQFGMRGDGLVMVDEFVTTLQQNYYLTIIYAEDQTNDIANKARVWIFPCSKYETVEIDVNTDSPVNASLSGKATYCRAIPEDNSNIMDYTHVYVP